MEVNYFYFEKKYYGISCTGGEEDMEGEEKKIILWKWAQEVGESQILAKVLDLSKMFGFIWFRLLKSKDTIIKYTRIDIEDG